jgi:hypothetical protein
MYKWRPCDELITRPRSPTGSQGLNWAVELKGKILISSTKFFISYNELFREELYELKPETASGLCNFSFIASTQMLHTNIDRRGSN